MPRCGPVPLGAASERLRRALQPRGGRARRLPPFPRRRPGPESEAISAARYHRDQARPVISGGWSSPISASSVGARSASRPSASAAPSGPPTSTTGTGLVRVGGVRPAGFGVDHGLAIAVVGGHDHRPAGASQRFQNPAKPRSTGLAGGDGGVQIAGMADHVGVGVVDHDQVVAVADRLDEVVGHLRPTSRAAGRRSPPWGWRPCSGPRPARALPCRRSRKKVTCGYFSVSAMWNWRSPCPATHSPSVLTISCAWERRCP